MSNGDLEFATTVGHIDVVDKRLKRQEMLGGITRTVFVSMELGNPVGDVERQGPDHLRAADPHIGLFGASEIEILVGYQPWTEPPFGIQPRRKGEGVPKSHAGLMVGLVLRENVLVDPTRLVPLTIAGEQPTKYRNRRNVVPVC